VFLTRAAGCAINDYADSDFDGKVERTANRPLATGVISKKSALLITAILSIGAFLLAWFCLKRITLLWSIPALLIFVSYPFFKRFFPIPQLYLGIAFSFGILMAFIEAVNQIPIIAIALFMANLFWVLAYDTIYALVDLPDDLKIGIKTSAITFGRHVIAIVMLCYVMFVLLLTYVGYIADLNWCYWLSVLIIIGLIIYVYVQIKHKDRDSCLEPFCLIIILVLFYLLVLF
jgi:4-hydroxybenzoate polyprenyltransferase